MIRDEENQPAQPSRHSAARELAWRRAAKAYVLLHAIVCICTWFLGLEHLIALGWVPVPVYIVVKAVAMFGCLPFLLSSPIVSLVMASSWRYHREWLYLGICDVALLVLQIVSVRIASM